jgi:hypothetical protein
MDGAELRQPLDVLPDPRVKASAQSYRREFALARRIEADRARAHAALGEIAKARADLAAAAKPAFAALAARAASLADPNAPDGLAALGAKLDKLETAADGADGGPSVDVQAGCEAASRNLTSVLATWSTLKGEIAGALASG